MKETKQSRVGEGVYQVTLIQVGIILIVALGFYFLASIWQSLSVLFGGAIALIYTLLLGSSVAFAASKQGSEQQVLYLGAVVRFVAVVLLFIVGLGWIKFDAIATVVTFCLAQLAYVASLGISSKTEK